MIRAGRCRPRGLGVLGGVQRRRIRLGVRGSAQRRQIRLGVAHVPCRCHRAQAGFPGALRIVWGEEVRREQEGLAGVGHGAVVEGQLSSGQLYRAPHPRVRRLGLGNREQLPRPRRAAREAGVVCGGGAAQGTPAGAP
nr:hypothetical protein [Streptomyces sp. 135]